MAPPLYAEWCVERQELCLVIAVFGLPSPAISLERGDWCWEKGYLK